MAGITALPHQAIEEIVAELRQINTTLVSILKELAKHSPQPIGRGPSR